MDEDMTVDEAWKGYWLAHHHDRKVAVDIYLPRYHQALERERRGIVCPECHGAGPAMADGIPIEPHCDNCRGSGRVSRCLHRRADSKRCVLQAGHEGGHDAGDDKAATMRLDGL